MTSINRVRLIFQLSSIHHEMRYVVGGSLFFFSGIPSSSFHRVLVQCYGWNGIIFATRSAVPRKIMPLNSIPTLYRMSNPDPILNPIPPPFIIIISWHVNRRQIDINIIIPIESRCAQETTVAHTQPRRRHETMHSIQLWWMYQKLSFPVKAQSIHPSKQWIRSVMASLVYRETRSDQRCHSTITP